MTERRAAVAAALRSLWLDRIEAAVRGGVEVVQLRWKDASTEDRAAAMTALRDRLGSRALLIVNDDVAAAARGAADGVHLGQTDESISTARERLGPEVLIGISTHSVAEARAAQRAGADYLGCGAMFETRTKPGATRGGPELAGAVARAVDLPVFAIGGIDASNLLSVVAAGCRRAAIGSAILDASDPEAAARTIRGLLRGEATER